MFSASVYQSAKSLLCYEFTSLLGIDYTCHESTRLLGSINLHVNGTHSAPSMRHYWFTMG